MGSIVLFALPLVIYLSLATLPKGRSAAIGLGVAVVLLAALRLAVPSAQGAATIALVGVALAAIAQAVRAALGPKLPPKLYLALLGLPPLVLILILSFSVGE